MSAPMIPPRVDCLVLGGGITGAGVAWEAQRRGLRTMLIDDHDFASGTSRVTSKLVHGGVRYLMLGQLGHAGRMVRDRDALLSEIAPHLTEPMRFVLLLNEKQRKVRWLGWFLLALHRGYGSRHTVPPPEVIGAGEIDGYCPGLRGNDFGLTYWDGHTDDARLVLSTIRSAENAGATVLNYTRLVDAVRDEGAWRVTLESAERGIHACVACNVIVNAAGPWAASAAIPLGEEPAPMQWLKGTHVVLARPSDWSSALIFESELDGRPLWAIPWGPRLLVGTTESRYSGNLRRVEATSEEVDYLLESFRRTGAKIDCTPGGMVAAFAGVRPIAGNSHMREEKLSRDVHIQADPDRSVVTITGGKLTTFASTAALTVAEVQRLLARDSVRHDGHRARASKRIWPSLDEAAGDSLVTRLLSDSSAAVSRIVGPTVSQVRRWVRQYGHDAEGIMKRCASSPEDAQRLFSPLDYGMAELEYLARTEWVVHLSDLLVRRTPIRFLADQDHAGCARELLPMLRTTLGWSKERAEEELREYEQIAASGCPRGEPVPAEA